jgi:hypothetical protein
MYDQNKTTLTGLQQLVSKEKITRASGVDRCKERIGVIKKEHL